MSTLAALESVSVSALIVTIIARSTLQGRQESGVGCRTTGTGLWQSAFCPYKGRRGRMTPLHRAIAELDPSNALARTRALNAASSSRLGHDPRHPGVG